MVHDIENAAVVVKVLMESGNWKWVHDFC